MLDNCGVFLLFYDLPAKSKKEQKKYRVFRKYLLKRGFCALQESVYVKLLTNSEGFESICQSVKAVSPDKGNVQALFLTLQNFQKL